MLTNIGRGVVDNQVFSWERIKRSSNALIMRCNQTRPDRNDSPVVIRFVILVLVHVGPLQLTRCSIRANHWSLIKY